MEYELLEGSSRNSISQACRELELEVNRALKDNWKLYGGHQTSISVSTANNYLTDKERYTVTQAMIKD